MSSIQPNDNRLGRAIASRRGALGLKRKDLAERARLSYPYISEIENGLKEPSARAMRQIADGLELTVADLAAMTERLESTLPVPVSSRAASAPLDVRNAAALSSPAGFDRGLRSESLGYLASPPSAEPADLLELIRAEVDRRVRDELPALVRVEVERALEERGPGRDFDRDGGPSS